MNDIIGDVSTLCDQIEVEHAAVVNFLGKQTIWPLLQDLCPNFRSLTDIFSAQANESVILVRGISLS